MARPRQRVATAERNALLPRLVEYLAAVHARESSEAGDRVLALRGDPAAIRSVIEQYLHRSGKGAIQTWTVDDTDLAIAFERLLDRLLDLSDPELKKAFGFSSGRKDDADRLLHRVIYFGVDHAMFGLGEARTQEVAVSLVADAICALPALFPQPLGVDDVLSIYKRTKATDPMG